MLHFIWSIKLFNYVLSVLMFWSSTGRRFKFRYLCSYWQNVPSLNTKVSTRANRISQSLQFINFQRTAAALRWTEIWLCLVWERPEHRIKGGSYWQQHKNQRQWDQRHSRVAPVCCWSTALRSERIHGSLDEKSSLLMGPTTPNKGPNQQFRLWTMSAMLSSRRFKVAPSLRGILCRLYRAARSVRPISSRWLK